MDHAVTFAPVLPTFITHEDGQVVEIEGNSDKGIKEKREFLDSLGVGDRLVSLMGGAGTNYLIAAHLRGVEVLQVPIHPLLNRFRPDFKDVERNESGAVLLELLSQQPEAFYGMTPLSQETMRLSSMARELLAIMKTRIQASNRFQAIIRDQQWLPPDYLPEARLVVGQQRQAVLADVEAIEKEFERLFQEQLGPTDFYQQVFMPIPRLRYAIGARILAEVGDIRRFPGPRGLRSYAGKGLDKDGKPVKRRKGESAGFAPTFRSALHLFAEKGINMCSKGEILKDLLDARKAVERAKFPEAAVGHIHRKGQLYVQEEVLDTVWERWWRWLGYDIWWDPHQSKLLKLPAEIDPPAGSIRYHDVINERWPRYIERYLPKREEAVA